MEHRFLYHISHYQNLPSILGCRGLSAYLKVLRQHAEYINIAHKGLQDRRSTTEIPVEPFGCLHDYVPFYFATRSPMLYAIKNGRVVGFEGNQNDIVYLVTKTDKIVSAELDFVFTDGHAIMNFTDFYNDLKDIDKIDWDIMKEHYWNDTKEDPDRKRRRQAEFLVHQFIDLNCLLGLGVRNERMKVVIEEILKEYEVDLPVLVKPSFYF